MFQSFLHKSDSNIIHSLVEVVSKKHGFALYVSCGNMLYFFFLKKRILFQAVFLSKKIAEKAA